MTAASWARPAGVTVTPARPDQHAAVRALLRRAYGGYAGAMAPAVFAVYLADVLDLDSAHATTVVASAHGEVLGTARLHVDPPAPALPPGSSWVRAVAVDPDHEGRGIARALMHAGAATARAAGSTALYLHTTTFMARAVRLYEHLGYRRAPAFDTDSVAHYGLVGEPPLVALAYRLDLDGR